MKKLCVLLLLLNVTLVVLNIFCGSVTIPAEEVWRCLTHGEETGIYGAIVTQLRLPAAITAMLTGTALGACGLLLQSYFRNPLAGPSILGITSGAHLAVAVSMLWLGITSGFGLTVSALVGAFIILLALLLLGKIVRQHVTLLIVGILLSYITSAILTLLNYSASAEGVQMLLLWGMGTFGSVTLSDLPLFATTVLVGLFLSALLIKPMNGWMMGELYAMNAGIDIRRTRWLTLLCTGLLCAITTAYCGPIAFVGLAMPHVARLVARTDDHRQLLPLSMLLGGCCCSLCLWVSNWPDGGATLPINALTPILGIPVILYVILRKY